MPEIEMPEIETLSAFSEILVTARTASSAGPAASPSSSPLLVDETGAVDRAPFVQRVASACVGLDQRVHGRQRLVFVVCDESHRFVACVFALNYLGHIAVPVYAGYTASEFDQLLETYAPALVISGGPFELACGSRGIRWVSFATLLAHVTDGVLPSIDRTRRDAALILFTSGSTSTPKGVVLTNDNILADLAGIQGYMHLGPADRCLIARTLTHASALVSEMLLTMLTGGTVVLKPRPPTMSRFFGWCAQQDVSWLAVTPAFLRLVLSHARTSGQRLRVRRMISLGASLPPALCVECLDTFPDLTLINAYGLTEASPRVSALPADLARQKPGAVGYPIAGCAVRVVAPDGSVCGPGVTGEIQIAGRNVTPGYFPEALVADPDRADSDRADRWWSTGDSGYQDEDGVLFVVGRRDSMIVHNGLNLYPEHLCDVIETCHHVRRAAVVQIDLGARGARLVAFVELTPTRDRKAAVAAIRRHLVTHLDARRHPDEILVTSSLPTLRSGKIDRRRLVDEYSGRDGSTVDTPALRRA